MNEIKSFFETRKSLLYIFTSMFFGFILCFIGFVNYDQYKNFPKFLSKLWDYNIYSANNANVTIGKIIIAVMLIVFGLYFAKSISNKIISKILKKTHLDKGAQAAIGKIGYYTLVIIFTLLALTIAEVPLTALTIFGGALAIGIGFGSQNLVNNFISGLIIQIERPVNVGDFVELEGISGKIREVGARSTKILSSSNTLIVVPNSYFLDRRFINWTLENNTVRGQINIGFANNIESEKIISLIKESLKKVPEIKTNPEPIIIMSDLSEIISIYTIFVWFDVESNMDKLIIESKIRKLVFDAALNNNYLVSLPKDKKDIPIP